MKILLLSDIHGNYPALAAVARRLPPEDYSHIVNCGDSLVYAPFANETLEWLKHHKAISILGNTDKKVIKLLKGKNFAKPSKAEKRIMYLSTAESLTEASRKYLFSLGKKATLKVRLGEKKGVRIGIFHGSPAAHHEFIFASTPISRFHELLRYTKSDIIVTGHSHSPYHHEISTEQSTHHFINPGSVGRMFDGHPEASCASLSLSKRGIEVHHYRVPYPVQQVISGLKTAHLPEIYCQMFQQGKKLN